MVMIDTIASFMRVIRNNIITGQWKQTSFLLLLCAPIYSPETCFRSGFILILVNTYPMWLTWAKLDSFLIKIIFFITKNAFVKDT